MPFAGRLQLTGWPPPPPAPPRRRPRDELHRRRVAPHGQDDGAHVQRGRHDAGVGRDGASAEDRHQAAGQWLLLCTLCTLRTLRCALQRLQQYTSSPTSGLLCMPRARLPQLSKPGRVHVTSCAYSSDGALIAGGLNNGDIQASSEGRGTGAALAAAASAAPAASIVQGNRRLAHALHCCLCSSGTCAASSVRPRWAWCRSPQRRWWPSRTGPTPRRQVRV